MNYNPSDLRILLLVYVFDALLANILLELLISSFKYDDMGKICFSDAKSFFILSLFVIITI